MKAKVVVLLVLFAVTAGLVACGGSGSGDSTVEPSAVQLGAVSAAQAALAAELGVDVESISLVKVQDETWSDGCLGLGGPAESCLLAETPGYSVVFQYGGKEYTYRTDSTGGQVRQEMISQ
jgi:hypothetical protein